MRIRFCEILTFDPCKIAESHILEVDAELWSLRRLECTSLSAASSDECISQNPGVDTQVFDTVLPREFLCRISTIIYCLRYFKELSWLTVHDHITIG
jgi:hypothetical protein